MAQAWDGWSPESVNQYRRFGQGLMNQGVDGSPVGHWTQALGRVLQAGSGAAWSQQANDAEREGKKAVAATVQDGIAKGLPMKQLGAALMGNPWGAEQGQSIALDAMKTGAAQGFQREQQDRQFNQQMRMQNSQFAQARSMAEPDQRRKDEAHSATMAQYAQMTPDQRRQVAPSIGITPGTPDHTEFIISGSYKPANANAAQNITWGRDAQGNPVPLQATRDGKLIASQMPSGVVALPPPEMAYAKSLATEQGTSAGKAQVDLPKVETNTELMLDAIKGVENHAYLAGMTGWNGYLPNMSLASRDAQSKIDQVQGKSFIQAYDSIRGGGAITEAEGAKATAAISRLQEMRVGTAEYRAALADVRREVTALRDVARRKAQGGNGYRSQAVIPPPGQPQTPLPSQSQAGDPLSQAREAIGRGADRAAVIDRLRKNGIDPAGL